MTRNKSNTFVVGPFTGSRQHSHTHTQIARSWARWSMNEKRAENSRWLTNFHQNTKQIVWLTAIGAHSPLHVMRTKQNDYDGTSWRLAGGRVTKCMQCKRIFVFANRCEIRTSCDFWPLYVFSSRINFSAQQGKYGQTKNLMQIQISMCVAIVDKWRSRFFGRNFVMTCPIKGNCCARQFSGCTLCVSK